MLILTIRTDNPQAELALYDGDALLAADSWVGHRQLGVTIHRRIFDVLSSQHKRLEDICGIACYEGPGSFTGLRIGLTVANALADSLGARIVAAGGPDWQKTAVCRLLDGGGDALAMPVYGAEPHLTLPRGVPSP